MKKPLVTLNLYLPNAAVKREIKRKAKAAGKSVSQSVIDLFAAIPSPKK
jgi:hypothetical protein